MLNCFYWYSYTWTIILILYSFKLSEFNQKLDNKLLIFILVTIIISYIIGYINRKKFKFSINAIDYGIKPLIIILTLFFINFYHAKSIPFFSIIKGNSSYGDFNGIPLLYIFLNSITYYFGINYFNAFLNLKDNKKRNLICFLLIIFMYLLVFSRSTILFLSIGSFLLYIMKRKNTSTRNFKKKNILLIIIFIFISLYLFGALGNIRSGYKYNNNSYIQRIGLYNKFPVFLPKQFMWSYSYLTSPLANLNNNIKKQSYTTYNKIGILNELINRIIATKLFPNIKNGIEAVLNIGINKEYFSAVTGYFLMYNYGGFYGMFLQFFILMIVLYIQIIMLKKDYNKGKENGTYIILLLSSILMFFYNSLNTTTISLWLIVNFISLINKLKIKWR